MSHPTLWVLFFGYGISLDPHLTFKDAVDVPKHDSMFLCVDAEDKKSIPSLRAAKDDPEKPWMYAELDDWSTVISFKPHYPLLADPETFAPRMIEWTNEVAADVDAFVSGLTRSRPLHVGRRVRALALWKRCSSGSAAGRY